tara:strand:+ start:14160 stop:14318 length:159 start_codon:yes stop_codon:yes gene_type:complete
MFNWVDCTQGVNLAKAANLCFKEHAGRLQEKWWAFPDLNWGPADYESDALTN